MQVERRAHTIHMGSETPRRTWNMSFLKIMPRRLRRSGALRLLVRVTVLKPRHHVASRFVKEGIDEPVPISSTPGHHQHTLESLRKEAREIVEKGVLAFVLFGVPARKDPEGSEAWSEEGVAQRGLRALRDELGDD